MVPGSARGQPSDRFAYARTSTPRGTPRCGTPRGGGATPRMSGTPRMNTPRGTPRDGPDDIVKSRQMPFSQVRVPNPLLQHADWCSTGEGDVSGADEGSYNAGSHSAA